MKLVLTLAALEDLRSIRAYTLETWGPDQEQRYLDQIWARFEDLSLHPDRYRKQVATGVTSPFLFLGLGRFLDATGNRPIAIRWNLENAMPIAHYREDRRVCGLDE